MQDIALNYKQRCKILHFGEHMKNNLICVKLEITTEELNELRSYCRKHGLKFQWYLGKLVRDEISRLTAENLI